MAIEFDRLVAYFDGDISALRKSAAEADRLLATFERKVKSLKTEIKAKFVTSGDIDDSKLKSKLSGLQNQLKSTAQSFNQATRDFSGSGLAKASDLLAASLDQTTKKGVAAEDAFRQFAPEINKLASSLKRGSSDQADYNQRFSQLPPLIQRAISETRQFGKGIDEAGAKVRSSPLFSGSALKGGLIGGMLGGAFAEAAAQVKQFVVDGAKMGASLDKLVRFTSTLDKNFQTPEALKQLTADMEQLSTEIPQTAEDIARASFTIKSAFQQATAPELIQFLRDFGIAATASNTDIATHAENVAALAKQYGITAQQLPKFSALIASSFGQALAKDSDVAKGFNEILNSAKATKQPLEVLIASMSTLQGASNDAAGNTTLLKNALEKLSDPKYIEGFKSIGIDVFDATGNFKDLNQIINEVARSIEGMSDADVSKKFDFLRDMQARQGFLTLARNIQAFNKQVSDGSDLTAYGNKTAVMLNSTEARWKRFWANVENGQREFGNSISDNFLAIFDQQTAGSQIQVFFVNLSALISKGVVGLLQGVSTLGMSVTDFIADSLFGLSPAEQERRKADLANTFNDMYAWIDTQKQDFARTVKREDAQYYRDILSSPEATQAMKESALKSLNAINESFKTGTKQTTATIKQSGIELKTSLDELAKNAQISPELRDKLKEEAKKIGDSVKQGVDESKPKIAASAKDLQDALTKLLGDARISAGLKDSIKKELDGLAKAVTDNRQAINTAATQAGSGFADSFLNGAQQGKQRIASSLNSLIAPQTDQYLKTGKNLGINFSSGVVQGILVYRPQVLSAGFSMFQTAALSSRARSQGYSVGSDLVNGFLGGMRSKMGEIRALSNLMGDTAQSGLKTNLQVQSPSKVFFAIGKDTAQGFIDGMNALRSVVQSTAADMLDIQNLTSPLAKSDADGVQLLTGLINEIARFNVIGKEQEILLELTAGKYAKLNAEVRDRILLAAREVDSIEKTKTAVDALFNILDLGTTKQPSFESLLNLFSDPKATAQIEARAKALNLTKEQLEELLRLQAAGANLKDFEPFRPETTPRGNYEQDVDDPTRPRLYGNNPDDPSGLFPVEEDFPVVVIRRQWERFFATFQEGIAKMRQSLPSVKAAIGENLLYSIESIGNVFGNAVAQWDGTAKGFFKSVGQGFRDLVSQLISELIRLMVIKAITSIIGAFAGGAAGAGGGGSSAGPAVGIPGHAAGGFMAAGELGIVGERGPELFIPASSGTVIPNDQTEKILGGGRGDNINVSITQNFRGSRGLTAQKSSRQAAEGAALGVSRGLKGRRNA